MAGIPGDLLKEATAAGKAATKGSERSYMGQLHSGITKAGESMGMSNNVSKYVAGLGMAGAGIGAFNIANNTSENHPFIGGAMKVGIIAGAGYAALKGHGGEMEALAKNPMAKFKPKAEHYNPSDGSAAPFTASKLYPTQDGMTNANLSPERTRPGSMNTFTSSSGKVPEGSTKVGRSGYSTASSTPFAGTTSVGGQNTILPTGSSGTNAASSPVGVSLGGGNTLVSDSSAVARNPNTRRPARRDKRQSR